MSIDVQNRIRESIRYMDYFIEELAYSYKSHYRIITDTKIPFPKDGECVNHDKNIQVTTVRWDKHPNKGWGKPDKMIGNDIELRYLWEQFKPLSFDGWLKFIN